MGLLFFTNNSDSSAVIQKYIIPLNTEIKMLKQIFTFHTDLLIGKSNGAFIYFF